MPICLSLVSQIQQGQQWQEVDSNAPQPLLNLIVNHSSEGKMSCSNNKGLFVVCFYLAASDIEIGMFGFRLYQTKLIAIA